MRRTLVVAVAIVACGGDGGSGPDPVVSPDRLVIVAGDGQVAPIAGTQTADLAAAVEGVLPDTLIARIEGSVELSPSITGPGLSLSMAGMEGLTFPAGTAVEYVVTSEGCGRPYIATATPDEDGQVRTLWEIPAGELPDMDWHEGVWGSRCEMEARAKVGTEFRADTTFIATFQPGPVDPRYQTGGALQRTSQPRVYPPRAHLAMDEYGNQVPSCPVFEPGAPVWTEGESWPACRSISWINEPEFGLFRVIGMDGTEIGHGYFEVYTDPANDLHALYLNAYGLDRPCGYAPLCQ